MVLLLSDYLVTFTSSTWINFDIVRGYILEIIGIFSISSYGEKRNVLVPGAVLK